MSTDKRLKRILVTNDDGIDAPGLAVAVEVAELFAEEVWVSAPLVDCSGRSRSLSLSAPLRIHEQGDRRFAVEGTPSDSAIVGVKHLMRDHKPDLVLSGVNSGANLSKDVHYSGTVGAALSACMLGVPAIALSQSWYTREYLPWESSRTWLPRAIERILDYSDLPLDSVYNINVPALAPHEITGIEPSCISMGYKIDIELVQRLDRRGHDYFWLEFERERVHEPPGTDLEVLLRGAVSVTPIAVDQTDHARLEHAKAIFST